MILWKGGRKRKEKGMEEEGGSVEERKGGGREETKQVRTTGLKNTHTGGTQSTVQSALTEQERVHKLTAAGDNNSPSDWSHLEDDHALFFLLLPR